MVAYPVVKLNQLVNLRFDVPPLGSGTITVVHLGADAVAKMQVGSKRYSQTGFADISPIFWRLGG
jgi:hypothetical protein